MVKLYFIFPAKTMYSVHPIPNQHKVAHTLHKKQQKNLLYTVTVKKKNYAASSLLLRSGHSTSSAPQAMFSLAKQRGKYRLAWRFQP